jgi:hypothetical protein
MEKETLKKANELDRKIREINEALNCFEWQPYPDEVALAKEPISTNPILMVEFDGGDGREEVKLPIILGNRLIDILKSELKSSLMAAEEELYLL